MVEPIGLAVGLAGLAGLFSVCLDTIEKIDAYKAFDIDSRSFQAQFRADKIVFRQWGRTVGIGHGKLANEHHHGLDDPDTAAAVDEILRSMMELESSANRGFTDDKKGNLKSPDIAFLPKSLSRHQKSKETAGKMKKLSWAFGAKARCFSQICQFSALAQRLYSLVPLDSSKRATMDLSANPYLDHHGDEMSSFNGLYF
jgi:hypothetical protein